MDNSVSIVKTDEQCRDYRLVIEHVVPVPDSEMAHTIPLST